MKFYIKYLRGNINVSSSDSMSIFIEFVDNYIIFIFMFIGLRLNIFI